MKAILFDLDGTLIDSIELIIACFTKTIETHLGYTPERSWILSRIGKPLRPALDELAPGNGEQLIATYREHQWKLHDEIVKPFHGIEDSLRHLAQEGLTLGIVTSKGRLGTDKALALMPSSIKLFSTIITVDDSPTHKPDPGPLLLALDQINQANPHQTIAPAECYYVGDTIFDMQAAVGACMKPVGVLWGVAEAADLSPYTQTLFQAVHELTGLSKHASSRMLHTQTALLS
jgi:pyrophosphatase PpaX